MTCGGHEGMPRVGTDRQVWKVLLRLFPTAVDDRTSYVREETTCSSVAPIVSAFDWVVTLSTLVGTPFLASNKRGRGF